MKVLHVIPSLSPSQGGPSFALPTMAEALVAEGCEVDVLTTDDDGPGQHLRVKLGLPIADPRGYHVTYFPKQVEFYKVSLPMLGWLLRELPAYSVVHVHAVFSFATLAVALACRLHRVPYVVRPLGVLNHYGMKQTKRWLKRLSFWLIDRWILNGAAAIHFTSQQEQQEAAELGLKCPPAVIPLGINLAPYQTAVESGRFRAAFALPPQAFMVLFLSRIHPKKGIELLIDALAQIPDPRVVLVIAGDGEAAYRNRLHQRVIEQDLQNRVIWTGALSGDLKRSAFADADLFALPSVSENFGIALLEAMASGLACLSSPEVALAKEAADPQAICIIPRSAEKWAEAIQKLLNNPEARSQLAHKGQHLAVTAYSGQTMAQQLHVLYQESIQSASGANVH
jgi:glycosyltransferase involved in cell wall biosynthesis